MLPAYCSRQKPTGASAAVSTVVPWRQAVQQLPPTAIPTTPWQLNCNWTKPVRSERRGGTAVTHMRRFSPKNNVNVNWPVSNCYLKDRGQQSTTAELRGVLSQWAKDYLNRYFFVKKSPSIPNSNFSTTNQANYSKLYSRHELTPHLEQEHLLHLKAIDTKS